MPNSTKELSNCVGITDGTIEEDTLLFGVTFLHFLRSSITFYGNATVFIKSY